MASNRGDLQENAFLKYTNMELLQVASYLARHDVAYGHLPEYPTEESTAKEEHVCEVSTESEVGFSFIYGNFFV